MACATLPSNHRVSPVRPWEPTTINSARHSSDSSTIAERGSPSRTVVSADSPASRSVFAARRVSSSALEACCCLTSSSVAPASTNSVAGGVYGCITAIIRTVEFAGHGRRAISSTAVCECGEPSIASRILISTCLANGRSTIAAQHLDAQSLPQPTLQSLDEVMPPRARATGAVRLRIVGGDGVDRQTRTSDWGHTSSRTLSASTSARSCRGSALPLPAKQVGRVAWLGPLPNFAVSPLATPGPLMRRQTFQSADHSLQRQCAASADVATV